MELKDLQSYYLVLSKYLLINEKHLLTENKIEVKNILLFGRITICSLFYIGFPGENKISTKAFFINTKD